METRLERSHRRIRFECVQQVTSDHWQGGGGKEGLDGNNGMDGGTSAWLRIKP